MTIPPPRGKPSSTSFNRSSTFSIRSTATLTSKPGPMLSPKDKISCGVQHEER